MDSGQIRKFTGNDYAQPLTNGDLAAAVAWSGDIVSSRPNNKLKWAIPETGGIIWTDNMLIPQEGSAATASTYMNFVYDPAVAAKIAAYVNYVTPVKGAKEELAKTDPETADNQLDLPGRGDALQGAPVRLEGARQPGLHRGVADGARRLARWKFFHRHRSVTPYLLLLPGIAWLALFFLVPLGFLGYQSLQSGNFEQGYTFSWEFSNYRDAVSDYHEQLLRSFLYAGLATVIALLISYPLVYWIAFRSGRWRNLFLGAIVAPLFVTYLVRTLAWLNILADEGPVVGFLRSIHVLGPDGRLLATSVAVVSGITYNFLPFMALPIYVSLEQLDARLLEAARTFTPRPPGVLRVTLPLSAPGSSRGPC